MSNIDPKIVDAVFPSSTTPQDFAEQTKTIYYDKDGKELAQGAPNETFTDKDWVARVSSMSLSIKVTPKIGNDFLSVERAMTIDLNTLDKDKVHGIWKNLQEQVVGGVFNTLAITLKQLNEVKKGQ